MNKYVKTFLGIVIILVPVVLTLGIFLNKLTKKSFYENSGEIKVSGVKSKVKIYSDEYGVPHIFAENDEDLYFALGYMHAQDRLWQMDVTRRAAEGRLSEVLGKSVLDYDKLFRTIGIDKFSYRLYSNITQKSREILQAYSNGVNKFIQIHDKELPVEFDMLNYKPEPWKAEQSLMVCRLMAWDLNTNWYADYVFREIINKVGLEKASEIFPDTTISIHKKPKSVESNSVKPKGISQNGDQALNTEVATSLRSSQIKFDTAADDFFEIYSRYRNFFGMEMPHSGSNSWVVSGDKSENGKPTLANDPHLNFQAPSKWYEVHLKSLNVDVTGMSVPGIPAVIIGHNRAICWGMTNLMNDDNDFVLLDRDSAVAAKYKYKNQSFRTDSTVERIEIKDAEPVDYVVRTTKVGPVISDIKENASEYISKNKILTFRWTGYEYSDEPNCFYKLSTAKNWDEFKSGLKEFGVPAQNFIYADTAGNIGYHAGGKIPVRKISGSEYSLFAEDDEWTGFVDFDKLPNEYNPKEGFLITANTNPFEWMNTEPGMSYYISWTWEPSSRYDRIKEMLQKKSKFNADEFKLVQLDHQSVYAREIKQYIADAYKDFPAENSAIADALNRLMNWNGDVRADAPEGAIFNAFLVQLIKNIYFDELGEKIFYDYLTVANLPLRATLILLKKYGPENTGWIDDIGTTTIETRDEIIRKSFTGAIDFLKSKFSNPDINTWKWGAIHRVKFDHPMGIVPALDRTFNIGPYEIGGDQTTVNNSEYSLRKAVRDGTFENSLGPSMRMITDLSDITNSLSINTTGQSGQPLHPNYEDQSRLWYYGDYKTGVMDELEMVDKKYNLLILTPE